MLLPGGRAAGRLLAGAAIRAAEAPEVTAFKEAGDWIPAQPADAGSAGAWWQAFGDAKLNELEAQLGDEQPGSAAPPSPASSRRGRSHGGRVERLSDAQCDGIRKRAAAPRPTRRWPAL